MLGGGNNAVYTRLLRRVTFMQSSRHSMTTILVENRVCCEAIKQTNNQSNNRSEGVVCTHIRHFTDMPHLQGVLHRRMRVVVGR